MKIILASSSTYRQSLLKTIIPTFECIAPDINENRLINEQPHTQAERLAIEKAQIIANKNADALIIGSDQVAWLGDSSESGRQLIKPGDRETNIEQLMSCQGKTVTFYTGLCLINSQTGRTHSIVETYQTTFRTLTKTQITAYVDREKAFDCAGGFKMEALGIALFEKISGDDPNILIGLPLIRLIDLFNKEGVEIL